MRHVMLLASLLATVAAPRTVTAQQPAVAPLHVILADADGDHVPDRLGDTVTVEGVITAGPVHAANNAVLANLQDASGGIVLFTRDRSLLGDVAPGDRLRVRGELAQHLGAEQIIVQSYERLGREPLPEPLDVLVHELGGERYSGRLVRVEGTVKAVTRGEEVEAWIEDRSGRIPLRVSTSWLGQTVLLRRLERGGRAEVVGILTQTTQATPPADGYRLLPRSPDDVQLAPRPRYDALAIGAGLALIVALVLWRRATAQRAQRLEALAADLERSREALRIREERFRSLVENAADTVSILDAQGTLTYYSSSVTRMLGWQPDELVGRNAFELAHPDDRERLLALFAELLQEPNGHREADLRYRTKEGEWRDLEVLATNRLQDPAVQGVICNARDITQHRVLEQRLRQADRLETVGRLAGGVAHDFNNILTALRGHAEIALAEMPEDAPGRADVTEILRNAERAADVTRQLLAFSRQQEHDSRDFSVSSVIRDMLPTLRRLIGEDVEVTARLCGSGDVIEADPAQLERVMLNLIINARDAMPDGGLISIEVAEDEITAERAAEYPYPVRAGSYVRVSVTDSGHGMHPEVVSRAFEPFFTTKQPGEGTGLGLATVYGIVKQSRGYVWVNSEPGRGARFDIFLPRIAERAGPEARPLAAGAWSATGAGRGERVLLVEDEPAVRSLAARVLRKGGYEVSEAAHAAEALQLLEEGLEPRIVLTDVVMPGMSGVKLAERIHELRPDLPVLLMSGHTAGEVVRRTGPAGPELLAKPFTPDQLMRHVAEGLAATV